MIPSRKDKEQDNFVSSSKGKDRGTCLLRGGRGGEVVAVHEGRERVPQSQRVKGGSVSVTVRHKKRGKEG